MEHDLKEWTEELRDGTRVVIRPIRPDDGPGIEAFIGSLSPQSKHLLFLGGVARLPKAELERLCRADYAHDMGYVAVPAGEANATPVGLVRYALTDPAAGAEISVAVADAWQGKGLGTRLLERLIAYAREHGVRRLYSMDTASNLRMRKLARLLGFTERPDPNDRSQVIYTLELAA